MIPGYLQEFVREGKVIPFIGAGVSMAVSLTDGTRCFPSWTALLARAAERLREENKAEVATEIVSLLETGDYMGASTRARKALRSNWYRFLKSQFSYRRAEIDDGSLALARAVWGLGSPLVITTNYDRVLLWACPELPDLNRWDIDAPYEQIAALRDGVDAPTIWHLHGLIDNVTKLILTPDGYHRLYPDADAAGVAQRQHEAALRTLQRHLASFSFLFIGFSLDDAAFLDQLQQADQVFEGAAATHYILVRESEKDAMRAKIDDWDLPIQVVPFADFGPPLVDKVLEIGRHTTVPDPALLPGRAAGESEASNDLGAPRVDLIEEAQSDALEALVDDDAPEPEPELEAEEERAEPDVDEDDAPSQTNAPSRPSSTKSPQTRVESVQRSDADREANGSVGGSLDRFAASSPSFEVDRSVADEPRAKAADTRSPPSVIPPSGATAAKPAPLLTRGPSQGVAPPREVSRGVDMRSAGPPSAPSSPMEALRQTKQRRKNAAERSRVEASKPRSEDSSEHPSPIAAPSSPAKAPAPPPPRPKPSLAAHPAEPAPTPKVPPLVRLRALSPRLYSAPLSERRAAAREIADLSRAVPLPELLALCDSGLANERLAAGIGLRSHLERNPLLGSSAAIREAIRRGLVDEQPRVRYRFTETLLASPPLATRLRSNLERLVEDEHPTVASKALEVSRVTEPRGGAGSEPQP